MRKMDKTGNAMVAICELVNFDRSSSTAATDGLAAVGGGGGEEGAGGGAGGWRQLHRHRHHYRRHRYHHYHHHQANEVSLIIVVITIINIKPTSQIINFLPRKRQLACAGADGGGRRQSCRHTNPRIALVDTSASLFEVIIVNNSNVLMIEILCRYRELPSSTTILASPVDQRDLSTSSRQLDHRDRDPRVLDCTAPPRITAPSSLLPSALYKPSVIFLPLCSIAKNSFRIIGN